MKLWHTNKMHKNSTLVTLAPHFSFIWPSNSSKYFPPRSAQAKKGPCSCWKQDRTIGNCTSVIDVKASSITASCNSTVSGVNTNVRVSQVIKDQQNNNICTSCVFSLSCRLALTNSVADFVTALNGQLIINHSVVSEWPEPFWILGKCSEQREGQTDTQGNRNFESISSGLF